MTKDKLERLADEIDRHSRKLMVPTGDTPALMHQAAVHLRRLAQVEAEHEALLKAISDAEPVLWMDADTKVLYEHDTTEVDKFHRFKPTVPLYTLNGIKKP